MREIDVYAALHKKIESIEGGVGAIPEQVQADWNETSDSSKAFIKNKPTIPPEQVQADWNETGAEEKAFIKNKPTIPAAQVQADWNEKTDSSMAFIKNKPTIPTLPTGTEANEGWVLAYSTSGLKWVDPSTFGAGGA